MPLFDTSALLPLFIAAHPHRDEAQRLFEAADQAILHPCVVSEFTTVMRRLAKDRGLDGNKEARRALEALVAQPRVVVRADVDHEAALRLFHAHAGISFNDAVVASGGPADLVTFDGRVREVAVKARRPGR